MAAQSMELLAFFRNKDTRGWKASRLELEEFTSILDKHPAAAKAKDDDNFTPMHHLAARALNATEHHVQMFALLIQRVPECILQKDQRGRLPQQLIKEAASEQATDHNLRMLDMLLQQRDGVAIGIGVGLAYTTAAIFHNNKVELIPNEHKQYWTPTWVAFDETDTHIGEAAKAHAVKDPFNSIYDMHRMAGKSFQDPSLQMDLKEMPFKVVDKLGGRPHVQVKHKDEIKDMTPDQLTALVLERIKVNAEIYLGKTVSHCVLTVPAHFTEQQRVAAKNAATICGINVLRVINEPTAAAMAYKLEQGGRSTILVYDLGGGTFDVTLLTVEDGIFDVKATAGDSRLGGNDFDRKLASFCALEIKRKLNKDVSTDKRAMRKILNHCEHAKKELSKAAQTTIEIDNVFEGADFTTTITRVKFEELCGDLFRATLDPVDRVLRNAKVDKSKVHKVVLVGGSTRIPKVQSLVSDFFEGVDILKNIGADVCVATGAAIQASYIVSADSDKVQEQIELDYAKLSIGVETAGGVMLNIIRRGDQLPIKERGFTLCTTTAHQPAILVQVYEGERPFARDNKLIGRFLLDGLECEQRGEEVLLKFTMLKNGNVDISAHCGPRSEKFPSILGDKQRFENEEVNKRVLEARQARDQDEKKLKPINLRNELENYAHWLRNRLQNEAAVAHMSASARALLEENVRATLDWLKANPLADIKEIETKKNNLETVELAAGKAYDQAESTTTITRIERID